MLVAAGTSIPDVATTIMAGLRGEDEIAVGNILGSNVANVLIVLPATLLAAGSSLNGSAQLIDDFLVVCAITLFFIVTTGSTGSTGRWRSGTLLLSYVSYYVYRVFWT